ncbi:MAG: hypothetical protein IPK60_13155 [Sandaracinaceae bacterium]|jgi:hypothetical protein|nr:hypothetical protein [Sandaracinaceae bacterium]
MKNSISFYVAVLTVSVCACKADGGSVDAGVGLCGNEYASATIQGPGGSVFDVCLSSGQVTLGFGAHCTLAATGVQTTDENQGVYMSFGADGDWFARESVVQPFGFYYGSSRSDACGELGARTSCAYTNYADCALRVTRAAHALGEYVEGELTQPCELRGGDGVTHPFPTLTNFRFRTRVAPISTVADGGACTYPVDGGVEN